MTYAIAYVIAYVIAYAIVKNIKHIKYRTLKFDFHCLLYYIKNKYSAVAQLGDLPAVGGFTRRRRGNWLLNLN